MKKHILTVLIVGLLLVSNLLSAQNVSSQTDKGMLTTPWTDDVTPNEVYKEYPRPQMEREEWQNLNGLWSYTITSSVNNHISKEGLKNLAETDDEILVPFPIESSLSRVNRSLQPDEKLWYYRTFAIPKSWEGNDILLHFGAVDWETKVWINGKEVGSHQGGYNPFSFDITAAIEEGSEEQSIVVSVWDPTDDGFQAVGKQSLDPKGIWYTPTSGIWQTVWLEPVPKAAIRNLKMTPDIDTKKLRLEVDVSGDFADYSIKAEAYDKGRKVAEVEESVGGEVSLTMEDMKLWSPSDPFLYDLEVSLYKNDEKVDEVRSYFGMRKIDLERDKEGVTRLFLNNEPLFHYGPLDQGFWPDGLYTAPSDEAMKFDIIKTKEWGFNMIRKHVKVEPARWYYYTDKIGLLVWQDMPNGDERIGRGEEDIERVAQSAQRYKEELNEMIQTHYNHPSIVVWVPFNEGWGQFKTKEIAEFTKQLDPSRLVNATTGWEDRGVGDMHDLHKYPGPDMFPVEEGRASVLGEFGGQALVVPDHLWLKDLSKAPNHYKTSTSEKALHNKYHEMMSELKKLKKKGLSAAVYTQTTDVESEVNGLMTYDRKKMKFDEDSLKAVHHDVIYGEDVKMNKSKE